MDFRAIVRDQAALRQAGQLDGLVAIIEANNHKGGIHPIFRHLVEEWWPSGSGIGPKSQELWSATMATLLDVRTGRRSAADAAAHLIHVEKLRPPSGQ